MLEVFVNDRYFVPWESKAQLKESIKVEAKKINAARKSKKSIKVEAKRIPKKKKLLIKIGK